MFIKKNITLKGLMRFTGMHLIWITAWMTLVTVLHSVFHDYWLDVPWMPISVIGTAVAFYVGFKNNQAYDRLWEARKIWGSIINDSRSFGSSINNFISNQFTTSAVSEGEMHTVKQRILYRHIAWLYTLRNQLLIPTPWEHLGQGGHVAKLNEKRKKVYGVGMLKDGVARKV